MMKNGRHEDAINCLISAVQHINENLQLASKSPSNRLESASLAASGLIRDDSQALSVPINSHQDLFVFRNPILVSEDLEGQEFHYHLCVQLAVVAHSNLALSYHLSALAIRSVKQLVQALSYYELSYKMLLREQEVVVSQAMIILNNIGHIHRVLENEEGARNCFQYLLTTMLFVQQSGQSDRIQNWDSFLSNVMDLMVEGCHAGAA
jgi:tetratricopeptide (TPR) repeat protein